MQTLHENTHFKKMLGRSLLLHLGVCFLLSLKACGKPSNLIDTSSGKNMNVVWAEAVTGPINVPDHKLPGPVVKPKAVATQAPKKVSTKNSKKKQPKKKVKEEKKSPKRKSALQNALAALDDDDDRPTPKKNNYAKVEGASKEGAPASPFSGNGALAGDPTFLAYKAKVKRSIIKNFVWLRDKEDITTKIAFTIDSENRVIGAKVVESSSNASFDQASLRAVRKASPLPPPPQSIAQDVRKETFILSFNPRKSI